MIRRGGNLLMNRKKAERMKILVGYDGSDGANAALEALRFSGLPSHADVLVLSSADVYLPSGKQVKIPPILKSAIQKSRAQARYQLKKAGQLALKGSQKIKRFFPFWKTKTEYCADSSAWALVKKGETWGADVIVVGSHSSTRAGRFLGSVSQMVLSQAVSSVFIGRESKAKRKGGPRVLVGLDGSPDSEKAFLSVLSRDWPDTTEFLLASVLDPKKSNFIERYSPSVMRWFYENADSGTIAAGKMLESYAKKLRELGYKVNCLVQKGNPANVLLEQSETWDSNIIFIGARGLTHLKRFFLGGVSAAVAARAHCSVEVVRAKDS